VGQGSEDRVPSDERAQAAWERGRAGNPTLALDQATFAAHLAKLAGGDAAIIDGLALEDVFLVCACLAGLQGAIEELHRRHGEHIRSALAGYVSASDAAELQQQLMNSLVVGAPGSPPKLASYGGRAPLERWLRVTSQRAALMWMRSGKAEARARQGAAAEPRSTTHPEVAYMKDRYREAFEHALEQALGRVSERDRALLRLHVVSGLSVERVGKMFGVSQPTASRWLAQAREALLADVKATLQAQFGAESQEIASLAGLVASRLDLSLSQLLKTA
jgi:RNA polymerase sigma-70 factor, ECF subfamily